MGGIVEAATFGIIDDPFGTEQAANAASSGTTNAARIAQESTREQLDFLERQRVAQRGDILQYGLGDWMGAQQGYESGLRSDLLQSEAQRMGIVGQERYRQSSMSAPYEMMGFSALGEMYGTAGQPLNVDVTQDPGYQFRLEEGLGAIERSAAARGMQLSGATLKDIGQYSQGLASQEYGAAYSRAENLRNQRLNMLMGLGQMGAGFTGQQMGISSGLAGQELGSVANLAAARQDPGAIYSTVLGGLSGVGQQYTSSAQQAMAMGGQAQSQAAQQLGQIQANAATAPWQMLFGAGQAAGGAAAAYTAFSDINLKRNFKHIGMLGNGLSLYTFNYLWSDDIHVGVMAQEVEILFPEAVSEFNGYKAVDYSRIM